MGRADDQPPLTDEEIQEVIGLYDGEVSQMDGALGMFFRALAARGEPLPLICFTADHGECLRGPRDYFGHGRGLYEDEVAVPLLVFCQSDTAAGVLVSRAAELVDVAPTAVRGLGLDLGPWRGGRDLLAPQADDVDQTARMYLGSHYRAAVEGTTKVLLDASDGSCFVYDLLADAQELNPVAVRPEDAGDKTARLRQLLAFEQASPQQTPEVAADRLEALEALGYLN